MAGKLKENVMALFDPDDMFDVSIVPLEVNVTANQYAILTDNLYPIMTHLHTGRIYVCVERPTHRAGGLIACLMRLKIMYSMR